MNPQKCNGEVSIWCANNFVYESNGRMGLQDLSKEEPYNLEVEEYVQNSQDVASGEDGIASLFSFGFFGSIYEVTYPGPRSSASARKNKPTFLRTVSVSACTGSFSRG